MKYLILFFLFLISFSLNSCSNSKRPNHHSKGKFELPPVNVETYEIKTKPFTSSIEVTGELQSQESTIITSEVMGKVIYLNIPEGQEVSQGHIIAKIEDSETQAEIKVQEAMLHREEAHYKRMKSLHEEGAISDQELDNANELLKVAEGTIDEIKSTHSKKEIKAPFNGTLSLKEISLGSYINPGDPIVRITKLNPINLVFSLPEKYISNVMIGQNINFDLEKEKTNYIAKIIAIDPYIDPENRTLQVKAQVLNKTKEMFPGRLSTIKVNVAYIPNSILIPQEALIQEGNTEKVFLVKKDIAEQVLVTTGEWGENTVQIINGLMDGDKIVTSGHEKIRHGSKITVKNNPS